MRKTLAAVVAALVLAPAARAAEPRIAVIDFQKAGVECDEGKAIIATLRKEMEEKQKQLDVKQKAFADMRADFEKQASLMNDQAKQEKASQLEKTAQDLQQTYVQLQQEFASREQEASKGVADRIRGLVKEVAEAGGIQVVVDRPAVVWANGTLDMTNEVIRKYNVKYPAKAGGVKPAGGTKPAGGAKPAGGK